MTARTARAVIVMTASVVAMSLAGFAYLKPELPRLTTAAVRTASSPHPGHQAMAVACDVPVWAVTDSASEHAVCIYFQPVEHLHGTPITLAGPQPQPRAASPPAAGRSRPVPA